MNPSANPARDPRVYDASVLEAMFGNAPGVISSVLATFVHSSRANLAELDRAAAAQDWASVAALAHKMAGACQMSGAPAMGHTALALEAAALGTDTAALLQGLACLRTQWAQVETAITHQTHATGP